MAFEVRSPFAKRFPPSANSTAFRLFGGKKSESSKITCGPAQKLEYVITHVPVWRFKCKIVEDKVCEEPKKKGKILSSNNNFKDLRSSSSVEITIMPLFAEHCRTIFVEECDPYPKFVRQYSCAPYEEEVCRWTKRKKCNEPPACRTE